MDTPISMHEFVVTRLLASRGRWREIAKAADISLRTLEKIARREIADPGVSHVQKLHDYLRAQEEAAA